MKNPAPVSIPEALSPAWLSAALHLPVRSVTVTETIKTVATKIRFRAELEGDAAPLMLCVKGLLDDTVPAAGLARMSRAETLFYRDIKPSLDVATPRCRYAGIDDGSGHGIIVMDDVTSEGGEFLTALSPYSTEQAAASLDQLATLHARYWGAEALDAHPWITSNLDSFAARPLRSDEELHSLLNDGRADQISNELRNATRVTAGLQSLAGSAQNAVSTLVHGDAHAGNIFLLNGRTSLIDWQVLQRSTWSIDVAYHVSAVLTVQDRRTSERALLEHYLDRLASLGVDVPRRDEAWEMYRASVAYGFYMWSITRRVDPAIIHEFVTRLGTAVDDLDSYDLLNV